jgi:photosystem II stability/assembly factor-like uncharacterized protein
MRAHIFKPIALVLVSLISIILRAFPQTVQWDSIPVPRIPMGFTRLVISTDGLLGHTDGDSPVYFSPNGGTDWTPTAHSTGIIPQCAGTNGWIFGSSQGSLFRSGNKGETWESPPSQVAWPISALFSDVHGTIYISHIPEWQSTSMYVSKSTDNGESWSSVFASAVAWPLVLGADGVWYAGLKDNKLSPLGVFCSPDTGRTWKKVAPPGFQYTPGVHGFGFAYNDSIASWTMDNGDSLQRSALPVQPGEKIYSIGVDSSNIAYAAVAMSIAPEYGTLRLYCSSDLGGSWDALDHKMPLASVQCFRFFQPGVLYIEAPEDCYRSTDGGQSWTGIGPRVPAWLGPLSFSSDGTVLASARRYYSYMSGPRVPLRSTDKCHTWTPVLMGLPQDEQQGEWDLVLGTSGGVLAGGAPGVFRLDAGAETWVRVSAREIQPLTRNDTGTVFGAALFGSRGLHRTTDNGWTWSRVGLDSVHVTSLATGKRGEMIACSYQNRVYISLDYGDTWKALRTQTSYPKVAITPGGRLIYSSSDTLYRSLDSGRTWIPRRLGTSGEPYYQVGVGPKGELFASTWPSSWLSTDEGATWSPVFRAVSWFVSFDNGGDVWTGADSMLFRGKIITTGILPGGLVPQQALLHQNYPNPFNPSTTIRYELPKSSEVRVSVYDMLGREVSVLENERREAGFHEVKFDGSNLASGVYFYRMQAGSFAETKRLILLR